MAALDSEAWVAIRALYENSPLSLDAIAQMFGTTRRTIYERRLAERWPERNSPKAVMRKKASAVAETAPSLGATGYQEMLDRAVRIIGHNLEIMETKMKTQNAGDGAPADQDRRARAVNTFVRSLEKVTEMKKSDDDSSAATDIDGNATAELRRELAERIYRMWGRPKR